MIYMAVHPQPVKKLVTQEFYNHLSALHQLRSSYLYKLQFYLFMYLIEYMTYSWASTISLTF
ncbi:Carbohydrate sulfotransferase 11 [Bienertia sinuspersici]